VEVKIIPKSLIIIILFIVLTFSSCNPGLKYPVEETKNQGNSVNHTELNDYRNRLAEFSIFNLKLAELENKYANSINILREKFNNETNNTEKKVLMLKQ
jgi:hypothetical protein